MDERNVALKVASEAMAPLKKIEDLYNTATNLAQQTTATKTASAASRKGNASIWSIVAAVVTFYVLYQVLARIFVGVDKDAGFGALILLLVICLAAAIFVFVVVRKKLGKESVAVVNMVNQNELAIDNISREIENVAVEYAEQINALPRDYRYYYAASFFENALANGRADNMKEAVNLFEVHLHQLRMESFNQQMLMENEQQTRMLATIEQNTRDTVRAVNENTAFTVLHYLCR